MVVTSFAPVPRLSAACSPFWLGSHTFVLPPVPPGSCVEWVLKPGGTLSATVTTIFGSFLEMLQPSLFHCCLNWVANVFGGPNLCFKALLLWISEVHQGLSSGSGGSNAIPGDGKMFPKAWVQHSLDVGYKGICQSALPSEHSSGCHDSLVGSKLQKGTHIGPSLLGLDLDANLMHKLSKWVIQHWVLHLLSSRDEGAP